MEGIHPDQVFDFPVPGDTPDEPTGIVLTFKHHSVAYWMAYDKALDVFDMSGETSNHGHMVKLVADAAIGWEGLVDIEDGHPLPFDGKADTLAKGLTVTQLAAIVYGLPTACQLTDLQRKKSKLPSPSSPENSAEDAEPGDVQTNPASQGPSSSTVQVAEAEAVTVAGALVDGS